MVVDWLGKLESIVKVRELFSHIKIFSDNDNNQLHQHIHIHIPDGGKIPLSLLTDVRKTLQAGLQKSSDGFLAVSESTEDKIKEITIYSKSDTDKQSRDFIDKNFPSKDKAIWFASLILRLNFENEDMESVRKIKQDIFNQHHSRGTNIANLCTARYLESHLIPLHEYLVTEKQSQSKFLEIYETIVTELPYAVFTSQNKSYQETKEEVIRKIDTVSKYGWYKVAIHGIGEDNVKKVTKIIEEIKEAPNIDFVQISADRNIVTASINIRHD